MLLTPHKQYGVMAMYLSSHKARKTMWTWLPWHRVRFATSFLEWRLRHPPFNVPWMNIRKYQTIVVDVRLITDEYRMSHHFTRLVDWSGAEEGMVWTVVQYDWTGSWWVVARTADRRLGKAGQGLWGFHRLGKWRVIRVIRGIFTTSMTGSKKTRESPNVIYFNYN